MDDIDELLDESRELLEVLGRMHAESMDDGELVRGMRPKIKSFLEHQRSALDYLVAQVNNKHCKKRPEKAFYPLAWEEDKFLEIFDREMPGVRVAEPQIAEAFAVHQPWVAPERWLKWLYALANPNKHIKLSRPKQRSFDQWRNEGGTTVQGIRFRREGQEPTMDPSGFIEGAWTKETITEWSFDKPKVFLGIALHSILRGTEATIADVRQAAGL